MRFRRSSLVGANRFRPVVESLEDRLCLSLAVPAFSSLPGANHTIYLDFDGYVTEGTQWNSYFANPSINSPAYDIDGDPASFSSTELARIENIWKRVAEDYIPFQANVTTVDPGVEALRNMGTGDTQWGIRVVITRDTEATGAGGIGYIGSFNWNSDTPVFVYNTSEVGVAEAASHEVGHSLYLAHDGTTTAEYYTGHGTGETGWAPIMGAGYYQNVTQWDRGEYYGANNVGSSANYNHGPDDLFVITNYNGFSYRADDNGNTSATATPLTVSGTNLSGAGIIERTTDVDFFSFTTTGGAVTLNIDPFRPGPDLDVRADLYDATGKLIATSNPADSLSASFNLQLAAGSYYLKVDGVGTGDPTATSPTGYTDYASLGRYFITGTANVAGTINPAFLSIAATSADKGEGNSGTTAFTFTVTRTGNTSLAATATYTVASSGAKPANATDFYGSVLPSGTVSFAAGETSKVITVLVRGDTVVESDETFTVTLSNPSANTQIALSAATGVIREDDIKASLQISASQTSFSEGTGTTPTPFVFTVTRSGSLAGTATVQYVVAGVGKTGNATASDFVGGKFPTGTISFLNGETSKQVAILIVADSTVESNEAFSVTLKSASSNATIAVSKVQATILNDDGLALPAGAYANDDAGPDLFIREPEELRDVIPTHAAVPATVLNYLDSSELAAVVDRLASLIGNSVTKDRVEDAFADLKNWWR